MYVLTYDVIGTILIKVGPLCNNCHKKTINSTLRYTHGSVQPLAFGRTNCRVVPSSLRHCARSIHSIVDCVVGRADEVICVVVSASTFNYRMNETIIASRLNETIIAS